MQVLGQLLVLSARLWGMHMQQLQHMHGMLWELLCDTHLLA
jgi:hypothetical protein